MKPTTTAWMALGLALGLAVGLGAYTFVYARGPAYLSNNSSACANCHVMRGHYDGWQASSHHAAASCNDCHTPHQTGRKYLVKALNGLVHSTAFTSGFFPEQIVIKQRNTRVAEGSCRNCHELMVESIDAPYHGNERAACTHCHSSVGHMDDLGVVADNSDF